MQFVAMMCMDVAAWIAALTFFRVQGKKIILVAALSGIVTLIVSAVLGWYGLSAWSWIGFLLVALLTALILPSVSSLTWRDSVTVLLITVSVGAVIICGSRCFLLLTNDAAAFVLELILCGVFVLGSCILRPCYAAPGWREIIMDSASEKGKFNCKVWHPDAVFAVFAVVAGVISTVQIHGPVEASLFAILLILFYWATLLLVLLMIDDRLSSMAVTSEQQYRAEMETFMNVIRSQRHDYNFHVQTLANMIRQGNMEACRSYVNELEQDSIAMNDVLPIADPAISSTIFNFRVLAAREGITLHIDVQNDLSHIATNVYESNKIISNLLQNAIDEVRSHRDKSYGIWLYIIKRGQYCMIHTANKLDAAASADHIKKIYRHGYTTKQGHEGVGLSSVKSLVERYHGVIYTRLEEDVIHFVVKVPMKFEASDEDHYRREVKEE